MSPTWNHLSYSVQLVTIVLKLYSWIFLTLLLPINDVFGCHCELISLINSFYILIILTIFISLLFSMFIFLKIYVSNRFAVILPDVSWSRCISDRQSFVSTALSSLVIAKELAFEQTIANVDNIHHLFFLSHVSIYFWSSIFTTFHYSAQFVSLPFRQNMAFGDKEARILHIFLKASAKNTDIVAIGM